MTFLFVILALDMFVENLILYNEIKIHKFT